GEGLDLKSATIKGGNGDDAVLFEECDLDRVTLLGGDGNDRLSFDASQVDTLKFVGGAGTNSLGVDYLPFPAVPVGGSDFGTILVTGPARVDIGLDSNPNQTKVRVMKIFSMSAGDFENARFS